MTGKLGTGGRRQKSGDVPLQITLEQTTCECFRDFPSKPSPFRKRDGKVISEER
jgi:hypothetical protein